MQENCDKTPSRERKELIERVVSDCRILAAQHIADWKPLDKGWPTVDGCAYLRLSDDGQVAVEKGSLEQQINIAISEALIRSQTNRVNYRITRFFIEPGLSGRDDRRPEFLAMYREIKQKRYAFVVIKEIARIARNAHLWKEFFVLCNTCDCEIFIRGLPFNPNNPTQILQLDILAAFAEYESNVNSKRLKESVFAAMVSSGKFNSTHALLGFDPLIVNGNPQPGFYAPNSEELAIVSWIMRTFVKYASYQKTMLECATRNIKTKAAKPFEKNSIHALLTNTKYIGEWEINIENKDKPPSKLMPYEYYQRVELPHGCVIDRQLWDDVQATVQAITGKRQKSTGLKRVYVLSGLLAYSDGTPFHGTMANGKTKTKHYYNNPKHQGLRLDADALDKHAQDMVSEIIGSKPALQEAIRRRGTEVTSSVSLLQGQALRIEGDIAALEREAVLLDRRLDFLLADDDLEAAASFRLEYKDKKAKIKSELASLTSSLSQLTSQKKALEADSFPWQDISSQAKRVLKVMEDQDPLALKNAYRALFEKIEVGELNDDGSRPLSFVLKEDGSSSVTYEEKKVVLAKEWRERWSPNFHP